MRIIRGKYGRRRFDVPGNITARPTTDFARENIFNVIENLIDIEGIDALDLFAGTGAVTFEPFRAEPRQSPPLRKHPHSSASSTKWLRCSTRRICDWCAAMCSAT